jgi:hypothetical protein
MQKKTHVQTYIRNEHLEYGTLNLTIAMHFTVGSMELKGKNIIKILEDTQYEQMGFVCNLW